MTDGWKAYYPDDGETADDARTLKMSSRKLIWDAEDAAQRACEYDHWHRDGWERTQGEPFPIVVIAPDGTETRWSGCHEASVAHTVSEAEDE